MPGHICSIRLKLYIESKETHPYNKSGFNTFVLCAFLMTASVTGSLNPNILKCRTFFVVSFLLCLSSSFYLHLYCACVLLLQALFKLPDKLLYVIENITTTTTTTTIWQFISVEFYIRRQLIKIVAGFSFIYVENLLKVI